MPRYLDKQHSYQVIDNICQISEEIDVFLFDGYGVLNVGKTAINGAVEQVNKLRAMGKKVYVVTNAATQDMKGLVQKYQNFGFNFECDQIINSREVMMQEFLARTSPEQGSIGVIVPKPYCRVTADYDERYPEDDSFWDADQFLFLSGNGWNQRLQERWVQALQERPRPIWVGNADLIAPLEQGVSHEPGSYTLTLDEPLYSWVNCYGKPYRPIFEQVLSCIARDYGEVEPSQVAMIGDTLHTDILGGAAMGFKTVLVTGSGFLRDMNVQESIEQARIYPDYCLTSI
ncbi:HAD-IIA family hydrolase [Celerinatantimonas diazotrophica]|nr:HAD hydrolase-like protein [Celerinatantimonas diazotrophica]